MKLGVIGVGYVGLVSAACLAEMGHEVIGFDVDMEKIRQLQDGRMPIHEAGLETMVQRQMSAGSLRFTTNVATAIDFGELLMIAVGTPAGPDGAADIRPVLQTAAAIGRCMNAGKVVVTKSTVPVGTSVQVRDIVRSELDRRGLDLEFHVVSNPEFLRQGNAIADFMHPDRIVIGVEGDAPVHTMRRLYAGFAQDASAFQLMNPASAELSKYAANAMLATRLSFINELALLADTLGADIESVRQAIGADGRIGSRYLDAGCGYGGSCLPKDVAALRRVASENGTRLRLLDAVHQVNVDQLQVLRRRVLQRFGSDLRGRRFGLWGLAYRPETDDMRDAPSRAIVEGLLAHGAELAVYDPVAMARAQREFGALPGLRYTSSAEDAAQDVDALLIATEWPVFADIDLRSIRHRMRTALIFDGRNLYDPPAARALGFDYVSIGRNAAVAFPDRLDDAAPATPEGSAAAR